MALCYSQIPLYNSPIKSPESRRFNSFICTFIGVRLPSSTASHSRSVPILILSPCVAGAATSKEYVYPDPDPAFAEAEVVKFRGEILKKLEKEKEEYGDSLTEVVNVCEQVLREYLQKEYAGPGTFMVEPFTSILVLLKEKKLPGAPIAARTSLLWAQKHLDEDWKAWTSSQNN